MSYRWPATSDTADHYRPIREPSPAEKAARRATILAIIAAVIAAINLLILVSSAWAGPEWRIFPSLPDPYRSGTVPLHFAANRADDGGGYGGTFGSGYGPGGVDGFSHGTTAVSKMRSDRGSGGWGGTAGSGFSRGPGGLHVGPI